MAISEAYAGSQSVTNDEWSLTTDTTTIATDTNDGVYQVWLDLNALVDGDTFTLKGYEKVQSADTQRVFFQQSFSNAQGTADNWVSPSFILMHGWDFTLFRDSANDRTITWSIRKIA